jgi:hypothetical protein
MARADFSNVDENAGGGKPIPGGQYKCKVDKATLDQTRHGDEMWVIEHVVMEGEHAGRRIFDRIIFSSKALPRAKLVLGRLGQDVSGVWEGNPGDIVGKQAFVTVEVKEYQDKDGNSKETNAVTYDGYEEVPEGMDEEFRDQF